jgi:hypothetical protein
MVAGQRQRARRLLLMPNPAPTTIQREVSPGAAFLSYLVPGLGQIYQGRALKGMLFLVAIYTLFFYGQALGSGTTVIDGKELRVSSNVYLPDTAEKTNPWGLPRVFANLYNRPQFAGQFWVGIAAWPAVWQYVTFDERKEGDPFLGTFQRTPKEAVLNQLQNEDDKKWDLGWVFTVIAGVLNIMVIYDALAGPAFGPLAASARSSEVRHGNVAVPANS